MNELNEYKLFAKGTTKYPLEELERKLNLLLGNKVGGELDYLRVAPGEDIETTRYSLAITWGFVENYILEAGSEVSLTALEQYIGVKRSTALGCLKDLVKHKVVYKSGYNIYTKASNAPKLSDHLENFPLEIRHWQPLVITFDYKPLGLTMERLEIDSSKFTGTMRVRNYLFTQLNVGDIVYSNQVSYIGGLKSRSQSYGLMRRLEEQGYVKQEDSIGSNARGWRIKVLGKPDGEFLIWLQQRQGQSWLKKVREGFPHVKTSGEAMVVNRSKKS